MMLFDSAMLMVESEWPEVTSRAPSPDGTSPVVIYIYVENVDATVVVSAPAEMQRARVLERGLSLERLEAVLARQMPDAEKRRRADFVVDSAHGIEHARTQVRQILAAVARMPPRTK